MRSHFMGMLRLGILFCCLLRSRFLNTCHTFEVKTFGLEAYLFFLCCLVTASKLIFVIDWTA